MKVFTKLKILALVVSLIIVVTLIILFISFRVDVTLPAIIAFVFILLILIFFIFLDNVIKENNRAIGDNLQTGINDALNIAKIGILIYDDNYQITWMSPLLIERELDHTGDKILLWLPELQNLLQDEIKEEEIIINEEKYIVTKSQNNNVLFFNDISTEYDLREKLKEESYVLGILSYDNYDESSVSEDDISFVNTNIKIPVIDYFKKYNIVHKTLRNNRMLLILNEKQFKDLMNDHFSILENVRKEAKKGELDITLSMAFARGSDDINILDEAAHDLIEIAQTRGGDQVVVRKMGEEATYYGGSSEAKEKQNKIKVRVITNTLKDLINKSSNIIIVGHNDMDADCLGSALCMSNIGLALNKDTYIVSKSGGMEQTIADILKLYEVDIEIKHKLVTENEAINHLVDDSLVIMVDHHSIDQSNGSNILKQAKRIVIIDHHRRKADLDFNPLLVYVEAGASSASELTCEFLQYLGKKVELLDCEANIIYLGILIDTNRFRIRTGSRTFDVAKFLRQNGADPVICDELTQESLDDVMVRAKLINIALPYNDEILISTLKDDICPRSIASQAADSLMQVKNIKAAFIICKTDNKKVIVTARSKGDINVQIILENIGGGGHLTAAGYQTNDKQINEIYDTLIKSIDDYYKKEAKKDESNIA